MSIPLPVNERIIFSSRRRISRRAWQAVPDPALQPVEIGTTLRGWRLAGSPASPTVIFFYGVRGTVRKSARMLRWIAQSTAMSALAIDYRGYAFSVGTPDFRTIQSDALTIYDSVAAHSPHGVFLFGESIGSTCAVHVAARREARGVVLLAPLVCADEQFTWYRANMVPSPFKRFVHFVPSSAVTAGMNNLAQISHVRAPLLVVHGDADPMVPFEGGRRLFDAAASRDKEFFPVSGAHHNDIRLETTGAGRRIAAFLRGH